MLVKGLRIVGGLVVLGSLAACSSGGGDTAATSTSVALSGSLKLNGGTQTISKVTPISKPAKAQSLSANNKVSALADSNYRISCATFEDTPKSCGAPVATDGSFSVTCDGFAGVPFGCFVFNKTSYKNYPIAFNVESATKSDVPALTSSTGTVTLTVDIDTETGTASAAATLPTTTSANDAVAGVGTTTLASLQMINGKYVMGPAQWSAVSTKYSTEEQAAMVGDTTSPAYIEARPTWSGGPPSCETGWTLHPDYDQNVMADYVCRRQAASAEEVYKFYSCRQMNDDSQCAQQLVAGTISIPTPDQFPNTEMVYFNASEPTAGKFRLAAWQSEAAYNKCGANDAAPTFKFSDGTTNVTINMAAADLVAELSTKTDSAITNWFPVLADVGGSVSNPIDASDVTCKYAYNLPFDFFNHTPEQLSACQASNTCFDSSKGGDAFNALWQYKWAKLFTGADKTSDTILRPASGGALSDANFSDNVVNVSGATTGYAQMDGWDSQNNRPQMTVVSSNDVQTLDLGGCMQWNTDGTQKIVKMGDYITFQNPDGTSTKQKCNWSERRTAIAASDATFGYFTFNGQKYRDVFMYVDVGGTKYQTYNKVCEFNDDKGTAGDTSDDYKWVNSFPADMATADIVTDTNARRGGGSAEDKSSLKLATIMQLLNSDGHDQISNSDTFFFWDPQTNTGGSMTCGEIKAGVKSGKTKAQLWDMVGMVFDNSHDSWQLSKMISCALIAVANDVYVDGQNGVSGVPDLGAAKNSFKDTNNNNKPDIFETIASNSCIPRTQIARICTQKGCDAPRVICNSVSATDGGCSAADPQSRMALMDVTPVGSGKYIFNEKSEWFNFYFDPSTNSGKKCTQTHLMQIKNDTAVAATVASGDQLLMSFQSSDNKLCDGDTVTEKRSEPKSYMIFKKL